MDFMPVFHCKCKKSKTNRLILDGGSEGNYILELCPKCYKNQDCKFVIKKEIITESIDPGRSHSNSVTGLITTG
ncbi:hypothetical protein [Nitrosopumilus piranensis]|uniref:Uncharacterized protein n=1 Tax=Nitrosopumilus piranensis TaxID=1582439 RepID=A0A0C5BPS7_9ARCH|nr:hypothetical protein [Nitrosopumilus piranensis]AJM91713.1 hypothetical protein NPIRD3C_0499 [Nitrosopumilus piranensis]